MHNCCAGAGSLSPPRPARMSLAEVLQEFEDEVDMPVVSRISQYNSKKGDARLLQNQDCDLDGQAQALSQSARKKAGMTPLQTPRKLRRQGPPSSTKAEHALSKMPAASAGGAGLGSQNEDARRTLFFEAVSPMKEGRNPMNSPLQSETENGQAGGTEQAVVDTG